MFLVIHVYRLKELEAAAEQLQAALLAELNAPPQGPGACIKKKGKAKKGKKKQVGIMSQDFDKRTLQAVKCMEGLSYQLSTSTQLASL